MFNHEPEGYKCPLCVFTKGEETELNKKTDIVFEDEEMIAYTSPKWWPNNPGNIVIVPRKHIENIYDIPDELLSKINILGKKVGIGIRETYGCDGISYRQHNEPAGNQDLWHFHLHVFPRWNGDDLYLNYNNGRYNIEEERRPYAKKLRDWFNSRK